MVSGAGRRDRTRDPLLGRQMASGSYNSLREVTIPDALLAATNRAELLGSRPAFLATHDPKNGGHFVAMFAGNSRYQAGPLVLLDRIVDTNQDIMGQVRTGWDGSSGTLTAETRVRLPYALPTRKSTSRQRHRR